eukprot:EG_transcript_27584
MTEPRCSSTERGGVQTPPAQMRGVPVPAVLVGPGAISSILGTSMTPSERSPVSSTADASWPVKDVGIEPLGAVLYHLHATTKTVESLIADLAQTQLLLAGKEEELKLMARKAERYRLHWEEADGQAADLQRALAAAEGRCGGLEQQVRDLGEQLEEQTHATRAAMGEVEALAARVDRCEAGACPGGQQVRELEGRLQRMGELAAVVSQLEGSLQAAARE